MQLAKLKFLRRFAIPLLRYLNPGDITIKNHYTGDTLCLHSFKHKGYWYHGKRREHETMERFRTIIGESACVIEIGGHIGYITQFFAKLVTKNGMVVVFEPGENNLKYLKKNIQTLPQVTLVEMAVSNEDTVAQFYLDDLTGQNNSLLGEYEVLAANQSAAFVELTKNQVTVTTCKLDSFLRDSKHLPDFVKIDIEGAEVLALEGMTNTLRNLKPTIMVEITANHRAAADLLLAQGYELFSPDGKKIQNGELPNGNTFALHPEKHKVILEKLSWS